MQIFTKMVLKHTSGKSGRSVGKPSGRVGVVGREGADATGGESVSCGGICVGVWERGGGLLVHHEDFGDGAF